MAKTIISPTKEFCFRSFSRAFPATLSKWFLIPVTSIVKSFSSSKVFGKAELIRYNQLCPAVFQVIHPELKLRAGGEVYYCDLPFARDIRLFEVY